MAVPRCRNGSGAGFPHIMEDVAGFYQYGVVIRADLGVTVFRRTIDANPFDPASYVTQDVSAIATVRTGLNLQTIGGSSTYSLDIEDDHFMLGLGVDDQGRVWLAGNGHNDPQRVVFSNAIAGVADLTTWNNLGASYSSMPWFTSGLNEHTYNVFNRLSDGRLIWFFDQNSVTTAGSRNWNAMYLPTGRSAAQILSGGTNGWRPLVDCTGTWTGRAASLRSQFGYNTENVENNNTPPLAGESAVRIYISGVVVEPRVAGDRIWVGGYWRTTRQSDGARWPFVVYSDSVGAPNGLTSWKTPAGATVTMPMHSDDRATWEIPVPPTRSFAASVAVHPNGRPSILVQNGVASQGNGWGVLGQMYGVHAEYGPNIRADWDGAAWDFVNLGGANGTGAGPVSPGLMAGDPARNVYLSMTGANTLRLHSYAGNRATGNLHEGTPVGTMWNKGHAIAPSDVPTVGGVQSGATDSLRSYAMFDPVAAMRGRVDLCIPDGDDPVVYSFGNHARITAVTDP